MTKKEETEAEARAAIKELRVLFRKGKYKAYTKLEHCSKSGMMRYISAFVILGGSPYGISHLIAKLGQYKRATYKSPHGGLKVHGCGMDMGFELIYQTSRICFKDKEENKRIFAKLGRYIGKNANFDGGYVVRQEWI